MYGAKVVAAVGFFLMLQAIIDDSRTEPNQGPVFILGGIIGTVQRVTDFADAWQKWRDDSPGIGYLKGREAYRLKGQFDGWKPDERDKKLLGFISLIPKFYLATIKVTVAHRDFADTLGTIRVQGSSVLKEPAYTAVSNLTAAILAATRHFNDTEKVQFIFDYEVVSRRELESGYRSALKEYPKILSERLASEPKFDDDKEFLALQAADLFAYYLGVDEYLRSQGKQLKSPIWDALSQIPCIDAPVTKTDLEGMRDLAIARITEWLKNRKV